MIIKVISDDREGGDLLTCHGTHSPQVFSQKHGFIMKKVIIHTDYSLDGSKFRLSIPRRERDFIDCLGELYSSKSFSYGFDFGEGRYLVLRMELPKRSDTISLGG